MTFQGKTILVADDNRADRDLLERILVKHHANVVTAVDGQNALNQFFVHRPDLVILDLMMPELDGMQACREIRLLAETPIILISASNDEVSIVQGLEIGAADYISKPYRTNELIARINRLLNFDHSGLSAAKQTTYAVGHLRIDLNKKIVEAGGHQVYLTNKEFRLLKYFLENKGKLLTSEQILNQIWGWEWQDQIEYVHVFVHRLRKKLEVDPGDPVLIVNEHGTGYRLVEPDIEKRPSSPV